MSVFRKFRDSRDVRAWERFQVLGSLGVPTTAAEAICDAPQRQSGRFEFKAADADGNAELLLYEFIGYDWWSDSGMTAMRFDEELKNLGVVKNLTIRINSPGGDVWDGMSIFNMLATYSAPTTVIVEGLAASIASVIAMAGDTVKAAEMSQLMIHDSWTYGYGNEQQLRELADVLAKIDGQIAETYAKRSGKPVDYFRELQDKDTYLTAAEAKDIGLVDEMISTRKAKQETESGDGLAARLAARQLQILSLAANRT